MTRAGPGLPVEVTNPDNVAMRLLRPILLSLMGSAAITGCSSTNPSAVEQARLTAAMQRWASNGGPNYRLELSWVCGECLPSWTHPLRILVEGGQVTAVVDLTTGASIAPNERTLTIAGLFGYIQRAVDEPAYRLVVEYHQTLGYPISVAVDHSATAVDDEGGFQVSSVELLP